MGINYIYLNLCTFPRLLLMAGKITYIVRRDFIHTNRLTLIARV